MRRRLPIALTLGLLGVFATTGVAAAADLSDRDQVMIGVAVVAIGLMALLLVLYLIKHSLGLDKMPPPEAEANGHH